MVGLFIGVLVGEFVGSEGIVNVITGPELVGGGVNVGVAVGVLVGGGVSVGAFVGPVGADVAVEPPAHPTPHPLPPELDPTSTKPRIVRALEELISLVPIGISFTNGL